MSIKYLVISKDRPDLIRAFCKLMNEKQNVSDTPIDEEDMLRCLSSRYILNMIAYEERPEKPIACLTMMVPYWGNCINVGNVLVDASHRRRGIGRGLLKMAIEVSPVLGQSTLTLSVLADNKAAINLYESVGFVIESSDGRCIEMHLKTNLPLI